VHASRGKRKTLQGKVKPLPKPTLQGPKTKRHFFLSFLTFAKNVDIANVFGFLERVTHNVFLSIVTRSLNKKRPLYLLIDGLTFVI
jgi:hypothetical protein